MKIEGQEPLRVVSYRGANQPNIAVDDPWQMYTRIFDNADLSDTQLAQLLAERKSVLDFLSADITTLRARVASEDKARLDAHLSSIRSLEQELSQMPISSRWAATCSSKTSRTTIYWSRCATPWASTT